MDRRCELSALYRYDGRMGPNDDQDLGPRLRWSGGSANQLQQKEHKEPAHNGA